MKKQILIVASFIFGSAPVVTEFIYAHKWSSQSNKATDIVLTMSLILIGFGAVSFAMHDFYFGYANNHSKLFRRAKALGLGIAFFFGVLILWNMAEFTAFRG